MNRFRLFPLFLFDGNEPQGGTLPEEPTVEPTEPVVETEPPEPSTETIDWAPYEELGLHEVPVEGLSTFLGFVNDVTAEDPDTAREAITNLAQSLGIDLTPTPATPADPAEDSDPVAALQARLDARDEADALATATQQAEERAQAEWEAVQEEHGEEFSEKDLERLQALALRLAPVSDEPIREAYDLIKASRGDAEAERVNAAPDTPSPAVPAGHASTGLSDIDDFDEAQAALIARRSGS